MDLDTFITKEHARVERFKLYWLENHAKHPEQFPMAMPANNTGLWWEMLDNFEGTVS